MIRRDGATRCFPIGEIANHHVIGGHGGAPIIITVVVQIPEQHAAGEQGGGRIGVRELLFEAARCLVFMVSWSGRRLRKQRQEK
jgi:hypothetical protein